MYAFLQALGQGGACSKAPIPFPVFARPCPSRPRHGYIESRVITTMKEAQDLLAEVLADDPNGEVMLTPPIDASLNAIWTPSSLVIGLGHDGATSGKDALTVPLAVVKDAVSTDTLQAATIGPNEWPYIEAVYNKVGSQTAILTQLRAGPPLKTLTPDYIPADIHVKEVIKTAGEDLPTWEALMFKIKDAHDGIIIWHPGGAVTDHFSVHCRTFKIPVALTFEPKVGDTILRQVAPTALDPRDMLKGILAGEKVEITGQTSAAACSSMLLGLHHSAVMMGSQSHWIGMSAAIMLRLGSCALRGEARHHKPKKTGGLTRDAVYEKFFSRSLSYHRAGCNRLINLFRYGTWSGSIGGIKWAQCGAATVELFNAVRDLAADPSDEKANSLLRALNTAVNQAHNGGWWMNKFSASSAFEAIQENKPEYILDCAPFLWIANKVYEGITKSELDSFIAHTAKWKETSLTPATVQEVEMIYTPGVQALGFRIKSRFLPELFKPIYAPMESLEKVIKAAQGEVFLIQTDNGYEVECRLPGQDPIKLWAESPLKAQTKQPRKD